MLIETAIAVSVSENGRAALVALKSVSHHQTFGRV
jgi:hypothetical protein